MEHHAAAAGDCRLRNDAATPFDHVYEHTTIVVGWDPQRYLFGRTIVTVVVVQFVRQQLQLKGGDPRRVVAGVVGRDARVTDDGHTG